MDGVVVSPGVVVALLVVVKAGAILAGVGTVMALAWVIDQLRGG